MNLDEEWLTLVIVSSPACDDVGSVPHLLRTLFACSFTVCDYANWLRVACERSAASNSSKCS